MKCSKINIWQSLSADKPDASHGWPPSLKGIQNKQKKQIKNTPRIINHVKNLPDKLVQVKW